MGFLETLKRYFGYDSFRGIQLDIVKSIYEGHDTLGLMPTGGGKSITFQVPALMMEGVCIVITPLIALMKDQVMHLKSRGIKAEAIHSGLMTNEIQRILDNAIYGAVKFLYVSPERLHTLIFQSKLYYMKVCFITVDEAHCISQWGYDFRPSYLEICKIREQKPEAPVLALTATATPLVVQDIQEKLLFRESNVFRMSFRRDNLSYVVRHTADKEAEMIHILSSVAGSAIVYVRNRKKTKEIAQLLNEAGITSTYYHAGLDIAIKDTRQKEWQADKYRVMVATNAFGMGIDKPDVRLVIHFSCPDSLEEYFQEAGRAGRDGRRAYAVMLYSREDRSILLGRTTAAFPAKEDIRTIYDHLAYFFQLAEESGQGAKYEFNMELFCYRFHHFVTTVTGALSVLQNAGYLEYDPEPDSDARVLFTVQRHELYGIQGLTPQEEEMITLLLRYYGSLFSELTFINENMLMQKLNVDRNHVHIILNSLSHRHIIKYVPRRSVPVITYTQQRIKSDRLRFPDSAYESLRLRMTERISVMLHYLDNEDTCRVRMLLDYFGEKSDEDCHHCDVCIDNNRKPDAEGAVSKIYSLLADGKRHSISELRSAFKLPKDFTDALEKLRNDDKVDIDDGFIILKE